MSIKIMSQVWDSNLPTLEKLVLLALADYANHEGLCYPSLANLAQKCTITKKWCIKILRDLTSKGFISVQKKGGGRRSSLYKICVDNFLLPQDENLEVYSVHPSGVLDGHFATQPLLIDPSYNHTMSSCELDPSERSCNNGKDDKKDKLQKQRKNEADELIDFLNHLTQRKFRKTDSTRKPIVARLKEGISVQQCKIIIARQHTLWGKDERMREYLRPSTLFRPSNFENYLSNCNLEEKE